MPKKISQLESANDVTASDLIQIVDIEDTGMAASGTNKKCTAQLMANELGKLTNVTATGSTTARSLANRFADVVNVKDFGAVGDGITDDTAAIQAAIDYASTLSGAILTGDGKRYAVSSQLTISGDYEIIVNDFNLTALEGTWPSGASGAVIKLLRPTNSGVLRSALQNITIDCNNNAKTGLYVFRAGSGTTIFRVQIFNFSEYGFWFKATGDGNNDVKVISCKAAECTWGQEPKFSTYSARTGVAFFNDGSADMEFVACTGSLSKHNLVIDSIWNGIFNDCKFWSGPARTDPLCVNVIINSAANRTQFVGCRFDDGAVKLYNFNHQFIGCAFIQYSYGLVKLIATSPDETASALTMVGNTIEADTISLETEGSGTWGGVLCEFVGNRKSTGTDVSIQDNTLVTGTLRNRLTGQFQVNNRNNLTLATGSSIVPGISCHNTAGGASIGVGRWSSDSSGAIVDLFKSYGTSVGSYAAVEADTKLGIIAFSGSNGVDNTSAVRGATIEAITTSTWSGNKPTKLVFSTTSSNTLLGKTIIGKDGELAPFADNSYSLGTSDLKWSVVYSATGTINTSDEREKDYIQDSDLGLEFIESLRPVSYKWKVGRNEHSGRVVEPAVFDDSGKLIKEEVVEDIISPVAGERTHYGLIAQEVKSVLESSGVNDFAGWVLADKNDPNSQQGLRYDQFICPLIKSVQELSAKVKALENQ